MSETGESRDTIEENLEEDSIPLVYIIIVNWNNYNDTSECLESISDIEYSNIGTIVVDNASTDGSGDKLKSKHEWPTYIFSEFNRGFAGGCNLGIRRARSMGADYVLVLNNDVIIPQKSFISNLVKSCSRKEGVGIISPLVHEYLNPSSIWFKNGEVCWPSAGARHRQDGAESNRGIVENDYIPFCGALISCEVFDEIGLIDESYFLYYEDVDFCYRAKEAGFRVITDMEVELYHKENRSTGGGFEPLGSYYTARNRVIFARQADMIGLPFYLSYIYWIVTRSIYRALSGYIAGSIALIRGSIDGFLGKSGRGPYP